MNNVIKQDLIAGNETDRYVRAEGERYHELISNSDGLLGFARAPGPGRCGFSLSRFFLSQR